MLDILAYDHVLFIIVLTIIYNFNQWKKVVWLITFFTIGHSITLGLAAFYLLNIPLEIVEFLIPVTICTTGFFNILKTSSPTDRKQKTLLFFGLFFGLIHGLGFSNYFRLLIGKEDDKILPLIEFAIGIEAAQIIIVLGILLFDLLGISSRYIDYDGFVSKRIAQNSFRQTTADKAILQDTTHYRVYEPQLGLNGARTAYFHNTIGGYHGAKPRRFEELINYYNTHQISGILDMLNIKYILFPNQETGALEPLKNPNFFGPAWTVQTLIEMPTADALLNRLKITDLKREALFIKGSLGIDVAKEYKLDSLATLDLNTITSNKINYRATSSVSQFIVFSEMYYPEGWTAKVNGKETPIYNLNYVLRGISVAPGVSEIEFEFTPLIIAKGTTIRWITVFLFLLSILTLGYFQFRKRKILQVWG